MRIRSIVAAAALAASGLGTLPAAQAAGGVIQPGDYIEMGGSACTLNFIYDGTGSKAGKTYGGTAAHCVGGMPIGQDIRNNSGVVFGDLAAVGNEDNTADDWALIEIRAGITVSAAVKGNTAYPKGVVTPGETSIGDLVQISGYGLGFSTTTTTQERRVAVLNSQGSSIHKITGPLIFGDSGGPLVHVETGKALGIVSRLCIDVCEETGPTVAYLMSRAAAQGFTVSLKTVP